MYNQPFRKGPIGIDALRTCQTNKKRKIKIGDEVFPSIADASRKFNVAHSTLIKYMREKKLFRGLEIQTL